MIQKSCVELTVKLSAEHLHHLWKGHIDQVSLLIDEEKHPLLIVFF